MNMAQERDIGAYLAFKRGLARTTSTAGAEAAINGTIIDRLSLGQFFRSAVVVANVNEGGIADTETVNLTVIVQHGDASNLSDATTLATLATDELLVTGTSGSTDAGEQAWKVDLSGAKRYVRVVITPDLSATDTDTAQIEAFWIFGGGDQGPTTLNA